MTYRLLEKYSSITERKYLETGDKSTFVVHSTPTHVHLELQTLTRTSSSVLRVELKVIVYKSSLTERV